MVPSVRLEPPQRGVAQTPSDRKGPGSSLGPYAPRRAGDRTFAASGAKGRTIDIAVI